MPGFIIHLAEARRIADIIKSEYGEDGLFRAPGGEEASSSGNLNITENNKRPDIDADRVYERFALGCILPDITDDKEETHFRPEWQKNLITKYPDIDMVLNAYEGQELTPEDVGIITHLRMDQLYVEKLWPEFFTFRDHKGDETLVWDDIAYVDMRRGGHVPLKKFFSDEYFYGDYDVLNPSIIESIQVRIPKGNVYDSSNIHIKGYEAVTGDMIDEALAAYCFTHAGERRDTRVFTYEVIMDFIDYCAGDMADIIRNLRSRIIY